MQLSSTIHRLSNGLQIILHPDVTTSNVMLQLALHTGSGNESKDQYGYAHLCEHLYFTGTPNLPNIDLELGPHGCENNAWTDLDQTCFVMSGPSESLDLLLWIEQDRFNNLLPNLRKDAFNVERDVVINEYHEEYTQEPYGHMWLQQPKFLFTESHPYGHPIVGTLKSLKEASIDSVKKFFKQQYSPNNAVLMLSGNFNPESTMNLINRYFESIPMSHIEQTNIQNIPYQNATLQIKDNANQSFLYLEWLLPAKGEKVLNTFVILSEILTGVPYGILYQKLELESQEVNDIEAYVNQHRLLSHFTISAAPISIKPTDIKEKIFQQLITIQNEGISDVLLNQVKQKIQLNWLLQVSTLWSRSENMLSWFLTHNSLDTFATQQDDWMNIKKADIIDAITLILESPYKEIHCIPGLNQ
jgi:zinc protease